MYNVKVQYDFSIEICIQFRMYKGLLVVYKGFIYHIYFQISNNVFLCHFVAGNIVSK